MMPDLAGSQLHCTLYTFIVLGKIMYSNIFYGIVFYCIVVLLCSNIHCFNKKKTSVSPKPSMVYTKQVKAMLDDVIPLFTWHHQKFLTSNNMTKALISFFRASPKNRN